METPDPLPPLRDVIARHGLSARKGLGQHFLFDLNLTRRIARASGTLTGHVAVEVGPGPGGLTRALLIEGADHVLAIERDPRCFEALEEIAAAYPGRLTIAQADALSVHEPDLIPEAHQGKPVRIVSNLPYNVGTPLLVRWLTVEPWPPWWASLTLMFQKEVVDRLVAAPRTKAYGRLSVLSQWRAEARWAFDVHASAFVPPPKVTSAVVHVTPGAPMGSCAATALERVTAAAFGQRRKMLRSSLKSLTPDPESLLAQAGIEPTARAETLPIDAFCRLAALVERNTPKN